MSRLIDISGSRYGRLLVLERGPSSKGRTNANWWCLCDCGNRVLICGGNLKNSNTQSCGCYQKECAKKSQRAAFLKHDLSRSRLYNIMHGMKTRCYNIKYAGYSKYGGRGIYICDEWLEDFMSFYNWAYQNGYKKELSLDRIDNNGPYSPENCRWATSKEQQNNTRANKLVTFNNKTMTIPQWGDTLGIELEVLRKRIERNWTFEEIVTTPVGTRRASLKKM